MPNVEETVEEISESLLSELPEVFRACLALETENRAACLIEVTKATPLEGETCGLHLVLLTQEGCPYCTEAKELYAPYLAEGSVREVDIDSDDGRRLVAASGTKETPELLAVDCDEELFASFGNALAPQ